MKTFYENKFSVEELTALIKECSQIKKAFIEHNAGGSNQISRWRTNAQNQGLLVTIHSDKRRQKSKRKHAGIVVKMLKFVDKELQYFNTLEVYKKHYSVGCALIENDACDYGVLYFELALDWFSSELLSNFDDVRRFELEISNSGLKELRIIVKTLLIYYYQSDNKHHKAALELRLRPFYRIDNFKKFIEDVNVGEEARENCGIIIDKIRKMDKSFCNKTGAASEKLIPASPELAGVSPTWLKVLREIEIAAKNVETVLLTGHPGVGKGEVAKAIYVLRGRVGEFKHVTCRSAAGATANVTLFGCSAGFATGVNRQAGWFDSIVENGVLFLDEIDSGSLDFQQALLSPLNDKKFEKDGVNTTFYIKGKVIVATNKDLVGLMAEFKFADDLYSRINSSPIAIPALSDRPEDIEEIILSFSEYLSAGREISIEAIELISNYFYQKTSKNDTYRSGNVRDLRSLLNNLVQRINGPIKKEHLPPEYLELPQRYSKEYYRIAWEGGLKSTKRTNIPIMFSRRDVVALVNKSNSREVADLYGVSHTTIQDWCKGKTQ